MVVVRVVQNINEEAVLLIDDLPIHRWGWSIENKLRMQAALHLFSADIVWIDDWSGVAPPGVQVLSTSATASIAVSVDVPQQSLQFPNRRIRNQGP